MKVEIEKILIDHLKELRNEKNLLKMRVNHLRGVLIELAILSHDSEFGSMAKYALQTDDELAAS